MFDAQDNIFEVFVRKEPLKSKHEYYQYVEGTTIFEILKGLDLNPNYGLPCVIVSKNGLSLEVPPDMWSTIKPRVNSHVEVFYRVNGPAAGFILSAALSTAAPAIASSVFGLTAGTFLFNLAVTGISIVGGLIAVALIPPAPEAGTTQKNYDITGTRNSAVKYSIYPTVLGRHRMFPPMTTTGYTEVIDNVIYWVGRYTFGWGPVSLEDLRIGTTPISEFSGVQIEFLNVDQSLTEANIPELVGMNVSWKTGTETIDLYASDITADQYNALLVYDTWLVRNTRPNTKSAKYDITFPQGLYAMDNKGRTVTIGVQVVSEYRKVGDTTWIPADSTLFNTVHKSMYRVTRTIDFPSADEWQIRVKRITIDQGFDTWYDDVYLTSIKSVAPGILPSHSNISEVAIRIRASEQLNGAIDSLNAVVQQLAPVWDGSSWSALQPVRHPAWVYLRSIMGPQMRRPVSDSRILLDDFKAWADEEPHWTIDYVVDSPTPLREVLDIVAAAGRARRGLTDLYYSIIRDNANAPVRQLFTGRNSWGMQGTIAFPTEIHGFRVRIRSEQAEWEFEEIEVYRDGYDAGSAVFFETLDLPGVVLTNSDTDQSNAWRLARYHMAQVLLRPEEFQWQTDFEHLVVTRGDKVRVVHDVVVVGIGSARIVDFVETTGIDSITLDDDFDVSGSYRLTVRNDELELAVFTATAPVFGLSREWTVTATTTSKPIKIGDLVAVELTSQESLDLLVTSIEHEEDLVATLRGIPASPDVLLADSGVIPDYIPVVTTPTLIFGPNPPSVMGFFTGRSAALGTSAGFAEARIGVNLHSSPYAADTIFYRLRWKNLEDSSWTRGTREDGTTTIFTGTLISGDDYYVEVMAIEESTNKRSVWVPINGGNPITAQGKDFVLPTPTGWFHIPHPLVVLLQGDVYDVEDFKELQLWASDASDGVYSQVMSSKTPFFAYRGAFTYFQIRAVDIHDVPSSFTPYIFAEPDKVDSDNLSGAVNNDIQTALSQSSSAATDATQALSDANDAQNTAIAVQTELSDLFVGFTGDTVQESLDDTAESIRIQNEQNLVALGPTILRQPASLWTNSVHSSSPTLTRGEASLGVFLTADADFGECYYFDTTDNRLIGAAYPRDFSSDRVYKIEVQVKMVTAGSSNMRIGVTTQMGTAILESNVQTPSMNISPSDGIVNFYAYVASNSDILDDYAVPADNRIVLSGSASATHIYYGLRQAVSLPGALKVASISFFDVTDVVNSFKEIDIRLNTEVDNINSNLILNYRTAALTDSAIASAVTALQSEMESPTGSVGSLSANLSTNYRTTALTDAAIAAADTNLKASMEGPTGSIGLLSADLSTNYRTAALTDVAIATANTNLQASMESPTGSVGLLSATVDTHSAALVDVEGFATAFSGLTVTTSSGKISGFKATAWETPDGSGALLELLGSVIAETSIATNKMIVGLGKNIIENSEFRQGLLGIETFTSGTVGSGGTVTLRSDGLYSEEFASSIRIRSFADNSTSGYMSIMFIPPSLTSEATPYGYPVAPGSFYEFSVSMGIRRVNYALRLYWYDANGVPVVGDEFTTVSSGSEAGVVGGSDTSLWSQYGGVAEAPVNAKYVVPEIRITGTNDDGNTVATDLHIWQPMLAKTNSLTDPLSPFSPGGTTLISGGRIVTEELFAKSITADKINGRVFRITQSDHDVTGAGSGIEWDGVAVEYDTGPQVPIDEVFVDQGLSNITGLMAEMDLNVGTLVTGYRRLICELHVKIGGVWYMGVNWGVDVNPPIASHVQSVSLGPRPIRDDLYTVADWDAGTGSRVSINASDITHIRNRYWLSNSSEIGKSVSPYGSFWRVTQVLN